eukprot:162916_1
MSTHSPTSNQVCRVTTNTNQAMNSTKPLSNCIFLNRIIIRLNKILIQNYSTIQVYYFYPTKHDNYKQDYDHQQHCISKKSKHYKITLLLEIYHSYPTKQDSNKLSDDLQTHYRQWTEKSQHFSVYYSHTNYLQFDHHICSQIFEHIFLQFYCDIYGFAATSNESL